MVVPALTTDFGAGYFAGPKCIPAPGANVVAIRSGSFGLLTLTWYPGCITTWIMRAPLPPGAILAGCAVVSAAKEPAAA